jgi:menaquinone-dependent protoporphyrinogen oxidase
MAIAPVPDVEALMSRIGARGHITFGGRLEPDAKGFPASAMAKTRSGDWRDPGQIVSWAREVADELSQVPS